MGLQEEIAERIRQTKKDLESFNSLQDNMSLGDM
jgi:hypothetical protein